MAWDEGDPGGNLSIAAKLKSEFNIELPELPEEIDVLDYLQSIERAIKNQQRWYVDFDAVSLAFFSYAKYLMYLDLAVSKRAPDKMPTFACYNSPLTGSGKLARNDWPGLRSRIDPLTPVLT